MPIKNRYTKLIIGGLLLLPLLSGCGRFAKTETASPVTPTTNHLVIGGVADTNDFCYWVDGARTDLASLSSGFGLAMSIASDNTYLVGYQNTLANSLPGYWQDETFTALETTPYSEGLASAITQHHGDIYIAGYVRKSASIQNPCYWKNGTRIDVSVNATAFYAEIKDIYVADNNLYLGGSYATNLGGKTMPVYWENGLLTKLPVLDTTYSGEVLALTVAAGQVYTAGYSKSSSGISIPCYWRDQVRTDLIGVDGAANDLTVANNTVYVAGYALNNLAIYTPCIWTNNQKTELPVIDATKGGRAQAIVVINGDVYVAGFSKISNNITLPCYWKNGQRTDLPMNNGASLGNAICIAQ